MLITKSKKCCYIKFKSYQLRLFLGHDSASNRRFGIRLSLRTKLSHKFYKTKKRTTRMSDSLVWMQQQPIFPDRLQSSIFGASELNFCVRYENRWDLTANVTAMVYIKVSLGYIVFSVYIYCTPF